MKTFRGKPKARTRELGWAGHFIDSQKCRFRRNTLVMRKNKTIIISTVGRYVIDGAIREVGYKRYYETLAFEAIKIDGYYTVDPRKPVEFYGPWCIGECTITSDLEANDMHDEIVEELLK